LLACAFTMSGDRKGDAANRDSSSSLPSSTEKEILESEALEELIHNETKRHLEAAWRAQQRLAQACFTAQENNCSDKNNQE